MFHVKKLFKSEGFKSTPHSSPTGIQVEHKVGFVVFCPRVVSARGVGELICLPGTHNLKSLLIWNLDIDLGAEQSKARQHVCDAGDRFWS